MKLANRMGVVALLLLATASYGWRANDEADQSAAFLSLSQGSLRVDEVDSRAYALTDNVNWWRRWDDTPVASTALNVLALPIAPLVLMVDWLMPLSVAASALMASIISSFVWQGLPREIRDQRAIRGLVFGGASLVFLLLASRFRTTWLDVAFYYPTVTLQIANMMLAVVGAELLWRAISNTGLSGPGRLILWFSVIVGPWLRWGTGLKYHMLAAVTVLLLLVILQRSSTRKTAFATGVTVGFAYWVNPMVGLGCAAGVGLSWIMHHRKEVTTWLAPVALGALLGVVPALAENMYLFGSPFFGFYHAGVGVVGGNASLGNATDPSSLAERVLRWEGVEDYLRNIVSVLLDGRRVEGGAQGILWVTPALAFGLLAGRGVLRSDAGAFTVGLLVFQGVLMTNAAIHQGFGDDVRLWFHVVPAFALLAAMGLRRIGGPNRFSWAALLGPSIAFLAVSSAVFASRFGWTLGESATDRRLFIEVCLLVTIVVALVVITARAFGRASRDGTWLALASCLLVAPLLWSTFSQFAGASSIPDTGTHSGGGALVPAMAGVMNVVHDGFIPPSPLPFVFDDQGNLVFHPEFGLCTVEPNPCPSVPLPDDLRRELEEFKSKQSQP